MAKKDKGLSRLMSCPSDYTFDELRVVLEQFGYELRNKGKTSGSRVIFYRNSDKKTIFLHKPHPGNIMKQYAVKDVINRLKENGDVL